MWLLFGDPHLPARPHLQSTLKPEAVGDGMIGGARPGQTVELTSQGYFLAVVTSIIQQALEKFGSILRTSSLVETNYCIMSHPMESILY